MSDDTSLLTGSTLRLFKEFRSLGIECQPVAGLPNSFRHVTESGQWLSVRRMMSEKLPLFSYLIADDKWWTYQLMTSLDIPTPDTLLYSSASDIQAFINKYRRVVVKPKAGSHGHGVRINITDMAQLQQAVADAKTHAKDVLIQEQVEGPDIRILVIGGKVISALERIPASVTGDGRHSVRELIEIENSPGNGRGLAGIDRLVKIPETEVKNYLSSRQLDAVPAEGSVVQVVGPSNHSLGGTIRDAIQTLEKAVLDQAESLASHLQMPIVGVDCVITGSGPKFIEINASPGIGIHDDNIVGITSGCFKAYAQLLYAQTA